MRFIDASVFVHAYLRPRRQLSPTETSIKDNAKRIVARVSSGERVTTTVVHFAEVANILEEHMSTSEALEVEEALIFKESIHVTPVSREQCLAALREAKERNLGLTDAIAYAAMKENNVREVYSFDKDFDRLTGIKRISE